MILRPRIRRIGILAVVVGVGLLVWRSDDLFEKRVTVVVPGKIVRGAWQKPGPLHAIIAREKIRTIVTLTAINDDDPKYVHQNLVVASTKVRWIFVPMRGSSATVEQMAEAADLLADSSLQPIFFHCVAGHHRSSLAQAAYRIRHEGWSAARAWDEVSGLPWARPSADRDDRRLIEAFAASKFATARTVRDRDHETRPTAEGNSPLAHFDDRDRHDVLGVELLDGELRNRRGRSNLSIGTDALPGSGPDGP